MNRRFRKGRMHFSLGEIIIYILILVALYTFVIQQVPKSAANAKANACYTNIDVLNSAIEMYNKNTGSYPEVLSEVTDNKAYFPDGAPTCPVHETTYPKDLTPNNRVDASSHGH